MGVELADDVHVTTWNNFLSDLSSHTLIEKNTPLFDKVLALEEGQEVKFNAVVLNPPGETCTNDSRLTLNGKVSDPEFIVRFTDVTPVE